MTHQDIINILKSHSLIADITDAEIREADSLLLGGVIDSLGLLGVVSELETSLGKPIPPGMMTVENFDSVSSIHTLATGIGR